MPLTPHLSLPEILIIGAIPLDRRERPEEEIREFSEVIRERIKRLEKARDRILFDIINNLYKDENLARFSVTDYLSKYGFIISPAIMPPELERLVDELVRAKTLDRRVREDILLYRNSIQAYRQSQGRTPTNIRELRRLEQTPVDLTFLYHPTYTGSEPHLIISKRKADVRVAGKIPYCMIDKYRDEHGKIKGNEFKRYLNLDDGITRDNVGLQFVTLSLRELAEIKGYIFRSTNMEVILNKEGEVMDDYYEEREGPYHAIHLDVVWNPFPRGSKRESKPQLFNPHADSVEVILIEFPYFINSNFGPNSYWRRMLAQEIGVVQKGFTREGTRQIDRFTPQELEWKQMVTDRIMGILTYGRSR